MHNIKIWKILPFDGFHFKWYMHLLICCEDQIAARDGCLGEHQIMHINQMFLGKFFFFFFYFLVLQILKHKNYKLNEK